MDFVSSLHSSPLVSSLDRVQADLVALVHDADPALVANSRHLLELGDPRTKEFPLMNPFHVLLLTLAYLFMVTFGLVLMKYIPFNKLLPLVKPFQFIYNLVLVALSFWIAAEAYYQAFVVNGFGFVGNPISTDPKHIGIARIMWVFYFSKLIEMADTLFMILRGSSRQISFLHVYHHATLFPIWWVAIYYSPGGDAIYSVIINSFIHTVMYSYYTAASVGISFGVLKHLLTITQMLQFCWLMFHSAVYLILDRQETPRILVWLMLIYSWSLLILFLLFFSNDLRETSKRNKKEGEKATHHKKKKD